MGHRGRGRCAASLRWLAGCALTARPGATPPAAGAGARGPEAARLLAAVRGDERTDALSRREELRQLSLDRFPLSDAPAQGGGSEEAQCPHGFYREAPIVFACGEQRREVSILLGKMTIELPKGLQNLKLAMVAEGDAILTLQNASDGSSTTGVDGDSQFGDEHGNQTYTVAMAATSNGSATAVFSGTLPGGLSFDLVSSAPGLIPATVTYSYEDVEPCPAVPSGCAVYNQVDSEELVRRWSAWASSEFHSPSVAWEALCVPALQASGAHELGSPVPFRAWPHVWARWPDAPAKSAQAAFKFIDSIHAEDQLIEVDEFVMAYKLSGISLSTFAFCVWMRQLFSGCPEALAQVGGPSSVAGINRQTWTTQVWPRFALETNFTTATAHQSFAYADASSDNVISQSELCAIWDMCPGAGMPNLSAAPPGAAEATLLGERPAEGNGTVELVDTSEGASTTERSTKCCQHFSAECMACQAGVGLGDFCGTAALSHLPGCDGAGLSAEDVNASNVGCPYEGSRFEPALEGLSWSAAHESACQLRCQRTLGCSYFSFRLSSSACTLHGPTARWAPAPGYAAGPRACTATVQLQRLDGSRTILTDALQDAMLMDFLPSLARVAGGQVRNFGGAIRPEVELPASRTLENVSALLQGQALRTALVESVRKVAPALVADVSRGGPFVAAVSAEDTGCLLPGTQYKGTVQGVPANGSNAIECRRTCKEASPSCEFFSYWNATATCLLFGPSAVPAADTGAISGAAACATPRALGEEAPAMGAFLGASLPANPTQASGALESLGLGGGAGVNWFSAVALATFCAGVVLTGLCLHHFRHGCRGRTSSGRRVGGEKDYLYAQLAREEPPPPQRLPSGI